MPATVLEAEVDASLADLAGQRGEDGLGSAAGMSPAAVNRLTTQWQADHAAIPEHDLSQVDYVYVWADGVRLRIGLGESKVCMLLLIGVRADGT